MEHIQRESFEAEQMDLLTSAFNAELASAKARIGEVVGHAMQECDGSAHAGAYVCSLYDEHAGRLGSVRQCQRCFELF